MPKSKRNLYLLASAALLFMIATTYFLFVFQKDSKSTKVDQSAQEIKPISDIELAKRPYVTLTPTSNGAEIIISIENMTEFENIEFELTYMADNPQIPNEKIKRGTTGTDVDTKAEKYIKNMLLGTASRGAASPDTGVEDGKLTLHMYKGDIEYQSETPWYMSQIGLTSTELSTTDGALLIKTPKLTKDYFVILTDTVGVPPKYEFDISKIQTPVYGVFSTAPKFTKQKADMSIKTGFANSKLYVFYHQEKIWGNMDSTQSADAVEAKIESLATYVVVSQE